MHRQLDVSYGTFLSFFWRRIKPDTRIWFAILKCVRKVCKSSFSSVMKSAIKHSGSTGRHTLMTPCNFNQRGPKLESCWPKYFLFVLRMAQSSTEIMTDDDNFWSWKILNELCCVIKQFRPVWVPLFVAICYYPAHKSSIFFKDPFSGLVVSSAGYDILIIKCTVSLKTNFVSCRNILLFWSNSAQVHFSVQYKAWFRSFWPYSKLL